MVSGTIVLAPNLTDEQLIALHQHYRDEEIEAKARLKRRYPTRFKLYKEAAQFFRSDVLKQMRHKIVNSQNSHNEEKS